MYSEGLCIQRCCVFRGVTYSGVLLLCVMHLGGVYSGREQHSGISCTSIQIVLYSGGVLCIQEGNSIQGGAQCSEGEHNIQEGYPTFMRGT